MRWANESTYDGLVLEALGAEGLGPDFVVIVKGMIATESGFVPTAYRAEAHYRCPLDGTVGDASRGLMQMLYCTAKGLGYTGAAAGLFDPATSIALGVQYLGDLLRAKSFDLWAAVSAYNNGNGRRATAPTRVCLARNAAGECVTYFTAQPGQFLNQPYVDKVSSAALYFAQQAGEPPPPPSGTPAQAGLPTALWLGLLVSAAATFRGGKK